MVAPLVLAAIGGAGALSLMGGSATDQAAEVAGEVVEESFAVIGTGIVKGIQGMVRAIREESKGHGVEITATITVITITYFFFKNYIVPPNR